MNYYPEYKATPTTYSDGKNVYPLADVNGRLIVALAGGGGSASVKDATQFADGVTTGILATTAMLYNPVTAGYDRTRTVTTFKTQSAVTITTETTVWTPTTGKKFRLMGGIISASAAGNITFKDNTAGTTILIIPIAANTPFSFDLKNGILSAAANNVLTATLSVAGTLSGTLFGTEE